LKASLIITTYNWPQALTVVLDSVLLQTYPDFEIIVADDGSAPETADTVRKCLAGAPLPWRHVRHDDKGIRQARVKNLAVSHAAGDYFIFIDHDVALHPRFVEDHIRFADASCFLQGKRVFLSPPITESYFAKGNFRPPSPWIPGLENRKNGFRLPRLGRFLNRRKKFQASLRGCNLSMHRDLFLAVDGYDEVFDGLWGREDSDICYRLFHSGWRVKNLWLAGLQYHLHHPSIKRRQSDRLDDELKAVIQAKRRRAIHGFSRLSGEGQLIASGF
jgi:glycosyltransferase involved in cell wall biosynthesis